MNGDRDALPAVDDSEKADSEKDDTEGDLTVETSPEEWRFQEGELLLDAVLNDGDRALFNQLYPHAEEGRAGVEASVELRAQELCEAGEERKAVLLVRAFRRLKKNAPTTPTQREWMSTDSGDSS
ncbi:hypothetical protein [Salinibacter ruber]|nr:hypothetical protein [Salinibacter ruber]